MMERLSVGLADLKLAGDGGADGMTFNGYGAVFGNVDSYGDVIEPGAFAETLAAAKRAGAWPAMLSQHGGGFFGGGDAMMPIGVWTAMEEDHIGLRVDGKLADTPRGREAYALLKMAPRPALNGLSIGFIPKEWAMRTKPEEPRRTLKKIELLEVSLVTMPANPKARVTSVKSLDEIETLSDAEQILRDAGFSRKEATAFIARIKAVSAQRDSAAEADVAGALRRTIETLKL